MDGVLIKDEWDSAAEANRVINVSKAKISECCLGKRKSAGGFIWKFKNPPAA
jgi:hypothetical protein